MHRELEGLANNQMQAIISHLNSAMPLFYQQKLQDLHHSILKFSQMEFQVTQPLHNSQLHVLTEQIGHAYSRVFHNLLHTPTLQGEEKKGRRCSGATSAGRSSDEEGEG